MLVNNKNFNPIKGLKNFDGFIIEYNIVSFTNALNYLGSKINENNKSDLRGIKFMKVLYNKNNKAKILIKKADKLILLNIKNGKKSFLKNIY